VKILVTGGAGFIGSHLCEALLRESHEVVALDNFDEFYDPAVKRDNVRTCAANDRFILAEGDIRDEPFVQRALANHQPDVIVHLAARAGVRPSIEDPLLYQDVNLRGTSVLLEAARRGGVRKFVFASSSSVYGNNKKVPFAESDVVDFPISPYAATKKAGELICHAYHHLFKMDITCLRYFTVYGPRQRPDLAIHKFARLMEAGRTIPVFGDGTMMRDYTYVDDIVAGTMSAINRCDGYAIFNLGGSRPVALSTLISLLEEALGKKALIDRLPQPPGDVDRTFADISLAEHRLDYKPRTPLEQGLREFVAWLRHNVSATSTK
jgi:UDP-glucuronate 4-epimerase